MKACTAFVVAVACVLACAHGKETDGGVQLREQVVFHNTTRFHYDHMTMIEQVNTTFLVMAWQASHIGEGHLDQRIVFSYSSNGGRNWTQPRDIIWGDGVPVWGPAFIFQKKTQRLFLYYCKGVPQNIRKRDKTKHYPGGDLMLSYSDDYGATWSRGELLLPYLSPTRGNISKMTANRPIFLTQDEEEWALPFWQEAHSKNDTGPHCGGVLVTTNGGKTHKPFGCLVDNRTWVIENSLALLDATPKRDGFGRKGLRVQMFFRTQIGVLLGSHSDDGGRSWGPLYNTTIPNPDSKAYLAARINKRYEPEELVVACNPNDWKRNSRLLLSLLRSPRVPPRRQDFATEVVLSNSTRFEADYPTVLQLLPGTGDVGSDGHTATWLVSFSAFSHQGAKIAWVWDGREQ